MTGRFKPGQVWEDTLGRRLVVTSVDPGGLVVGYSRLSRPEVARFREVAKTEGWTLLLDVEGSNVL